MSHIVDIEDIEVGSGLQQAQEEANMHFIIQDFSSLVLSIGPHAMLHEIKQCNPEAHEELLLAFSNSKL